jgi:hypothetical protein
MTWKASTSGRSYDEEQQIYDIISKEDLKARHDSQHKVHLHSYLRFYQDAGTFSKGALFQKASNALGM